MRPGSLPASRSSARWVIHTVGPVWHGGHRGEADRLASCYRSCLTCADEVGATSVAFPAISTGAYGYPAEAAAAVAVETVAWAPTAVQVVRFVCFDSAALALYDALLAAVQHPDG